MTTQWKPVTASLEAVMQQAIAATVFVAPGPWFAHPDTGRRFRVLRVERINGADVAEIEWESVKEDARP